MNKFIFCNILIYLTQKNTKIKLLSNLLKAKEKRDRKEKFLGHIKPYYIENNIILSQV
jgi:hypothetical protein